MKLQPRLPRPCVPPGCHLPSVVIRIEAPKEVLLEKEMAVFLPGKFHGQRSLVDYSPWGGKESDITELLNNSTIAKTQCCQRKPQTV